MVILTILQYLLVVEPNASAHIQVTHLTVKFFNVKDLLGLIQ